MDTNEDQELWQQRQRRNRINRMKTGIILSILIWMIVSIAAIVVLSVQVIHLHQKVDRLLEQPGDGNTQMLQTEEQPEFSTGRLSVPEKNT